MGEFWEESDCEMSKGESQKIRSEGDSNHRIAKSGKESECTYSAKGVRKDSGVKRDDSRI